MRYLAIDYGLKRTGLAVCDQAEMLASPLKVIDQPGRVISDIQAVIKTQEIDAIVIGLPLNMDDSEGPQSKLVKKFAATLEKQVKVPIVFFDERLSSYEAEGLLAAGDYTNKKMKARLDAVAAAAILRSFLDHKHASQNPAGNHDAE